MEVLQGGVSGPEGLGFRVYGLGFRDKFGEACVPCGAGDPL